MSQNHTQGWKEGRKPKSHHCEICIVQCQTASLRSQNQVERIQHLRSGGLDCTQERTAEQSKETFHREARLHQRWTDHCMENNT